MRARVHVCERETEGGGRVCADVKLYLHKCDFPAFPLCASFYFRCLESIFMGCFVVLMSSCFFCLFVFSLSGHLDAAGAVNMHFFARKFSSKRYT